MAGRISSDASPAGAVIGHIFQQVTSKEIGERSRICPLFKKLSPAD